MTNDPRQLTKQQLTERIERSKSKRLDPSQTDAPPQTIKEDKPSEGPTEGGLLLPDPAHANAKHRREQRAATKAAKMIAAAEGNQLTMKLSKAHKTRARKQKRDRKDNQAQEVV